MVRSLGAAWLSGACVAAAGLCAMLVYPDAVTSLWPWSSSPGQVAMNPFGYAIANGMDGSSASVDYVGEYFEMLTLPLRSRYSEVQWPEQAPVPLPADVVARFANRTMAITGYEVDVVRQQSDGSLRRVPCYEQYNHHYVMYIMGRDASMGTLPDGAAVNTGHDDTHRIPVPNKALGGNSEVPISTVFSEGNGNEHRRSFHGYAKGFAQLVDSPATLVVNPMMINIGKPGGGRCTAQAPHAEGPCPAPRNSLAPPGSIYSGLLECPCTDRKVINVTAGTIDGLKFSTPCMPEPYSDLLAQHNPSCDIRTYSGGQYCCRSGTLLLDSDQAIPEPVDEFYLKLRFYFEDHEDHSHLFRLYWQTEANHREYDVMGCDPGTPAHQCVAMITSHFQLKDMMKACDQRTDAWCADSRQVTDAGIWLMYAAAHCHAPMCISVELYNADTGALLCRNEPIKGSSETPHDEEGYVVGIPPCVWGFGPGLQRPPVLHLDTNLTSVKRANATASHHGDMASWQMRGTLARPSAPRFAAV